MRRAHGHFNFGIFLLMLVLLFLFVQPTSAQEEILHRPRFGVLRVGSTIQSWSRGEDGENMTQSAFPMILKLPLSDRFLLTIVHTPGLSWRNTDAFSKTLHGLSDTWIQGAAVLWEEKLLLNFGMGIPTGKTRLTNDEYAISKIWLSRNIFRFQVPIYGQGFCGRMGMAMAFPVGEKFVVGIGGQYLYRTPYHPVFVTYDVAGETRVSDKLFEPGDEINANLGFELGIGDNLRIMMDAVYSHYWRDVQEGVEVYGPGDRFSGHLGLYYRFDQRFLLARFVYRQQGKNEVLQGLTLQDEEDNTNGDQYEFYFTARVLTIPKGSFHFMLDSRYEGKNAAGRKDDFIVGGGVGFVYNLLNRLNWDFHFKYLNGWYQLLSTETFQYERETIQGFEVVTGLEIEL